MIFNENLSFLTPTTLFVVGLASLAVVVFLTFFSIWRYSQAKKIAPLLKDLENLKNEISTAQQTLATSFRQREEVLSGVAKSNAELQLTQKLNTDLKSEINARKRDAAHWHSEAEKEKNNYKKEQEKTRPLQDTNSNLEAEIAKKNKELGDMEAKIKSENENLKKIATEVKDEKDALQQVKISKDIASQEKEDCLKKLKAELSLNEQKERDLMERLNKLNAEMAAVELKIEEKKKELEKKERDLQSQVTPLEDKIAVKQREIASLEDRLRQLGVRIDESNEYAWASLDEPVFEIRSPKFLTETNEQRWLEEFSQNLKDSHLSFDERIIKAFHTSLKSAEAMPIAVLSGISGTGKSLLPLLYAKAQGMNLLPIPVQPRWDGPQDIFGFYNYIESCYKATPLARLLWQYKDSKEDDLPMSIVLLDEMNLARVEYYFSELLSKLEILRTGDTAAASIILECSGRGRVGNNAKAEFTRVLPLRRNILFVGTMNEDETTQTLSDKVLDRSAVMRFGPPKKLETAPNIQKFNQLYGETNTILTYHAWKELPENNSIEILEDILKETNIAMVKVDRPFGHRIANAIRSYVANYPGDVGNAISDAYEMKIFPKLNGLETDSKEFSELKSNLKTILDNKAGRGRFVFDAELAEAFEKACSQDHAYFKWRGTAR